MLRHYHRIVRLFGSDQSSNHVENFVWTGMTCLYTIRVSQNTELFSHEFVSFLRTKKHELADFDKCLSVLFFFHILTLKPQSRLQQTTFINIFHCFSEKIGLDVSSESSARQRSHMKNEALFSSKDKSKKLKCRLLQFCLAL